MSADALFVPNETYAVKMSDEQRVKLAFMLHTAYGVKDMALSLLHTTNKKEAEKYLLKEGISVVEKPKGFSSIQDIIHYLEAESLTPISGNHKLPEQLIVSLTSYKARFNNLHLTLRSLLLQETQPDLLILWIAEHEKNDIPNSVWELEQYGLSIRFCDDLRSYKKIIPALEAYPDSFIVTADDDIYYQPDWLQKLVESWDGDYKTIIAHRAHKIRLDDNGQPVSYHDWKWQVGPEEPADGLIIPTGCGGIMYPPHAFHEDVSKSELFIELCPDADDIWLYWMASLNGAKAKRSDYDFQMIEWQAHDTDPLWKKNIYGGNNDTYIRKMTSSYGMVWDTLGDKKKLHKKSKIKRKQPKICLVYRDYSGSNTVALYHFLVKHRLTDCKNLTLVRQDRITTQILTNSDVVITTHGPIFDKNSQQMFQNKMVVDMWHGFIMKTIGLKMLGLDTSLVNNIKRQWSNADLVVATNESNRREMSESFALPIDKVKSIGYPRNDYFKDKDLSKKRMEAIFGKKHKEKKVVIYAPTYRKSVYWPSRNDGAKKQENVFGINGFDNSKMLRFLEDNNIFLCIKVHPAEEFFYKDLISNNFYNSGNIEILSADKLERLRIDFYELLASTSALITDCSSIFIDYLLLDKPVLFSMPDKEAFNEKRGLLSNFESLLCGPICNTQNELEHALSRLDEISLSYKVDRERVKNIAHAYTDGCSSKRAWQLINKKWALMN